MLIKVCFIKNICKGSKLLHTSVRCSSYHKKQEGDFQANSKEDPTLNFSFAKHGNFLQVIYFFSSTATLQLELSVCCFVIEDVL